jgi:hypothetical protein
VSVNPMVLVCCVLQLACCCCVHHRLHWHCEGGVCEQCCKHCHWRKLGHYIYWNHVQEDNWQEAGLVLGWCRSTSSDCTPCAWRV